MKILISPQKYIQGEHAIKELGKWAKVYGKKAYVILDDFVRSITEKSIQESSKEYGIELALNKFNGESSMQEINRHIEQVKKSGADVIVGIGGGKTLDTAKAVAYLSKMSVIISPTLASTDAPTSALAIIYTPEGAFESYMHLPLNPNIVLVDTALIINAPTRLLVSGMGDALATYYEAKVCVEAKAKNMAGGESTKAAFALATLCAENLYKYGEAAKAASDANTINEAFEIIVESNTLLSGLGFESSGLAAAHSIHDGLTELEETHHFFHGEKVAFGAISQAVFDNDMEAFERIVAFCIKVGLPTDLDDLGIKENIEEKMHIVAKKTVHEDETIHSYPFEIKEQAVYDAMMKANKLVKEYKAKH